MRAAQVQGGRGSSSVCSVCTVCSVCSACVVCVVCVRVCVTVEVSTEAQAQFVAETLWKLPLPLNALPRRVEPLGHVHDVGTNVSERKFMWLNVLHLCQHHIKDIGPLHGSEQGFVEGGDHVVGDEVDRLLQHGLRTYTIRK